MKTKVLDSLERDWRLQAASDRAGVDQSTVWRWRQADRIFDISVRECRFWTLHAKEAARVMATAAKIGARFERAGMLCR